MNTLRAFQLSALGVLCAASVSVAAHNLVVESPDMQRGRPLSNAQVFDGFGCTGSNQSPALKWGPLPAGTKSIAITAYDPDAPTGSGWWHWIVYNIRPSQSEVTTGAGVTGGSALPPGAKMGRNDFGAAAYGGACPPPGAKAHRYVFTVYALKIESIEVPADASAALIGFMLNSNTISKGSLVVKFGR